jgi:hypothetical protein
MAILAVVAGQEDESPTLHCLDGDHLHSISVLRPGQAPRSAEVVNVMRLLDPLTTEVSCRKVFVGNRVGLQPIPRLSHWHFKLGDFTLEFDTDTHVASPFVSISSADGFALSLADKLGWRRLPDR